MGGGEAMVIELITGRIEGVQIDGDQAEVLPRDAISEAKQKRCREPMWHGGRQRNLEAKEVWTGQMAICSIESLALPQK